MISNESNLFTFYYLLFNFINRFKLNIKPTNLKHNSTFYYLNIFKNINEQVQHCILQLLFENNIYCNNNIDLL